jgi:MFS family permease
MQEIINTITKEGFKFPFKDKNWANKFGVYCLINLVPTFILITVVFLWIIPFLGIVAFALLVILLPIIIIFTIYLQGYILEIIKRTMNEENEEIPEHDNIKATLKLGLIRLLIELPPTLLGVIFILLSIGLMIGGFLFLSQEVFIMGIILTILGIVLTIVAVFFTLFITTIVLPAMIYTYLKTGSIQAAYRIQNIHEVVRLAWKEFLIIWGIALIGSTLVSTLGQLPCMGTLIMVVGYSYVAFVLALVMGRVYLKIKSENKIKLT